MKKIYLAGILAAALALLSGCKAIEGSGTQKVHIDSFPKGAMVYINDLEAGKTPLDVTLSRKEEYNVVIKREGFQDIVQPVSPDPDGGSFLGYGSLNPRVINAFLISDYVAGTKPAYGSTFDQMKEAIAWAQKEANDGKLDKTELKYVREQISKHYSTAN